MYHYPSNSSRAATVLSTTTRQILRAPRRSYLPLPVKFSAPPDGLIYYYPSNSPRAPTVLSTTTRQILRAPRRSYLPLPVKFSARPDGLIYYYLSNSSRPATVLSTTTRQILRAPRRSYLLLPVKFSAPPDGLIYYYPSNSPRPPTVLCTTTCQILRAPRRSYLPLPVKFSARPDGLMWGRLAACGRLSIGPASGARLRARRSRPRQPETSRAVGLRLCCSAGQDGIQRRVGNPPVSICSTAALGRFRGAPWAGPQAVNLPHKAAAGLALALRSDSSRFAGELPPRPLPWRTP